MLPMFSPTKVLDSLILMQIVLKGQLHGYALASLIEEKFGWKPSQTAIYNSLKAMEKAKLIASEERIEKGRVQILYSITEQGRQVFEERRQLFKKHIQSNFSRFISFVQMINELENLEDSQTLQLKLQSLMVNLEQASRLTFLLVHKAPTETAAIINKTLKSLEKLAKKHQITIPTDETSCF